jgi:hypothetical protein
MHGVLDGKVSDSAISYFYIGDGKGPEEVSFSDA